MHDRHVLINTGETVKQEPALINEVHSTHGHFHQLIIERVYADAVTATREEPDWLQGEDVVGEQVTVADLSTPPLSLDCGEEDEAAEGGKEKEGGECETEEEQRGGFGFGAVGEA